MSIFLKPPIGKCQIKSKKIKEIFGIKKLQTNICTTDRDFMRARQNNK